MATKKSVSKKAPVAKKAKKIKMQSFKLSRPDSPFFTFAITRQTLYWVIITLMVLVIGLWVIQLQVKMNTIYDTIEFNQSVNDTSLPEKVVR